MICKKNFVFFAFLLFSLAAHSSCLGRECSLESSVNKYREIQITRDQKKRLDDIDYLIQYYTDLSFVRDSHKISPDFIRALILAESGGNPKALSNKNARGLAQILYSTGKQAAAELACGENDYHYVSREQLRKLTPDDLYNPAINILITCYLIDKYNHQYQGRLALVVSAWNAGPGSIKNDSPPPYTETCNHIGRVNGYFVNLLKRWNG